MTQIPKRRLLETLAPYVPEGQGEALFRAAIADAGLPARLAYRPEEVAVIGAAIMQRAQTLGGEAIAEAQALT